MPRTVSNLEKKAARAQRSSNKAKYKDWPDSIGNAVKAKQQAEFKEFIKRFSHKRCSLSVVEDFQSLASWQLNSRYEWLFCFSFSSPFRMRDDTIASSAYIMISVP